MGLEFGKAKNIYLKGSCPQKKGKRKEKKNREKPAFNPSILDPTTVLVNKAVGGGGGEP